MPNGFFYICDDNVYDINGKRGINETCRAQEGLAAGGGGTRLESIGETILMLELK